MTDLDAPGIDQVDIRGPRFAAWVTTAVLAAVILLSVVSVPAATALLAVQAFVFAIGAARGPRSHPDGLLYSKLVAPRLGPVTEREPVPPLRFAQLVGLVFALVGIVGFISSSPVSGIAATAFALFAAFLNAAFGICLGCKLYPLAARLRPARDRV